MRIILTGLMFLLVLNASGQNQAYFENITSTQQQYHENQYLKAAESFSKAFAANNQKGQLRHRYNAAQCWAMAGVPDSAFFQLERIANNGFGKYSEYDQLIKDPDLETLHADKRWPKVVELIKATRDRAIANYNQILAAQLDTVYSADQIFRKRYSTVEQKLGPFAKELRELSKIIAYKDSVNLVKVKAILDKHGWLGSDSIGQQGSSTLFLVIQHSDQQTQEKYLPMLREAVKQNKASKMDLALLEDRVALGQGKKQIYGSQIGQNLNTGAYYVLPLQDPENVDERRQTVNLPPLKDYVTNWGIIWTIENYKKGLKENEAHAKDPK